jgi:Uma2 family endonuclease
MSDPIKRGATYDDLMELPENLVGEIVGGDLFASPRPRLGHARLQLALGGRLQLAFGERRSGVGGWWLLSEPELHLGPDALVPDIAGWRRTRMPELPAQAPWSDLAPDWVCEVLSPGTARHDRIRKLPVYAREGVGHAWLVDPEAHVLEVYRLENELWVVAAVYGGDGIVRPEPFAAAEFDLSEWWSG